MKLAFHLLCFQAVGIGVDKLRLLLTFGGELGDGGTFIHGHEFDFCTECATLVIVLNDSATGGCNWCCSGFTFYSNAYQSGFVETIGDVDELGHRLVVDHVACHHY